MMIAFELGKNISLSLAELEASLVNAEFVDLVQNVCVVQLAEEIDLDELQAKLGGVIKIMHVQKSDNVSKDLETIIFEKINKMKGKFHFGVSEYNEQKNSSLNLAYKIKKKLRLSNKSVRLVNTANEVLTSVTVKKNKLLTEKGIELIVIKSFNCDYVGSTFSVQDFESYGRRDYDKPYRDARMGMLPPKLAQIMLNLARMKKNNLFLDPFCGSGTVLMEGALLGYQNHGSDFADVAIDYSIGNLNWLNKNFEQSGRAWKVKKCDAKCINQCFDFAYDAIVTEGTLGPVYRNCPDSSVRANNFRNLHFLYREFFKQALNLLKPKGKLVITFPCYLERKKRFYFPEKYIVEYMNLGYRRCNLISAELADKFDLELDDLDTILYFRQGQLVARELLVFEKI